MTLQGKGKFAALSDIFVCKRRNSVCCFTSANGVVGNIDLKNDALLWRQKLPAITTSHCAGNLVYIGVGGGELLALDVHSGKKKWHKVLGWEVTTITAHAGQLYLTGAKGRIMRLLPRVGETVWQYNLGTSISVPAQNLSEHDIFCHQLPQCLRLPALDDE